MCVVVLSAGRDEPRNTQSAKSLVSQVLIAIGGYAQKKLQKF